MASLYRTTAARSLRAIAFGIAICGVAFAATVLFVAALDGNFSSIYWSFTARQLLGSMPYVVAAAAALICVVGVPLWLPFHFSERRHWGFAIMVGALVFFAAWFVPHAAWFSMPLEGYDDDYGWFDAAGESVAPALLGVAVAGAMWRSAYRPS